MGEYYQTYKNQGDYLIPCSIFRQQAHRNSWESQRMILHYFPSLLLSVRVLYLLAPTEALLVTMMCCYRTGHFFSFQVNRILFCRSVVSPVIFGFHLNTKVVFFNPSLNFDILYRAINNSWRNFFTYCWKLYQSGVATQCDNILRPGTSSSLYIVTHCDNINLHRYFQEYPYRY